MRTKITTSSTRWINGLPFAKIAGRFVVDLISPVSVMQVRKNTEKSKIHVRKRNGQALLITVLLMVLATAMAATFVTVVARNLQQTGGNAAEAEAQRALKAGLSYARLQLQTQGLRWRPKNDAPPPSPYDAEYSFYYDDFDHSQNWHTTGVAPTDASYQSDGFVRLPDPRSTTSGDALPFMLKVEKVQSGDADNAQNTRTGDLRISVIGRSSRSITTFARATIYQQGAARNPLTSALRTVSNWDFGARTVPSARVKSVSSNVVTLENVRGAFPASSFNVMFGDAFGARGVRGAVAESYTSSTRALKLAAAISPLPQVGERVELAAALGWQNAIDFDNNGALEAARESVMWNLVTSNNASAGGVRVNGGLLLHGDIRATLRSSQISNAVPSTIRASGLIQFAAAPLASATSSTRISGEHSNGATANVALLPSDSRDFPWVQNGVSSSEKAQLVDDGANRIAGNPDATRVVEAFEPPDISGGGAQNRYRLLSQSSPPADANAPSSASLYGYGQGIYLNNEEDREQATQNGARREMTPDELRLLWTSHATTPNFLRLATAAKRTTTADQNKSLEEQHLRGWIAPDEFRARGALVEINADNTITITLDSRDDGLAFSLGAAPHKGWRDANGLLKGDANAGGVYRQTFAWPQNGVIFGEGNLRVRGTATNSPRSLTIVSMNNIYIEGSLGAGTKKIALLAKQNVVLNPTRVLERPDDQTLLRQAITSYPATQIRVFDASGFTRGDWIFVDNPSSSTEQDVCVESVDTTNNIIYLNAATPLTSTTSQPVLRPVRIKTDPIQNSGVPFNRYNRLERFGHVLQRRFKWNGSGEVRLALRHSAERKAALRVPYFDGVGAPTSTRLGFKIANNVGSSLIQRDEKVLSVTDGANTLNAWGIARPLPNGTKTTQYDLNWLGGDGTLGAPLGTLRSVRTAPSWRYADPTTPLIFNDYGVVPINSSRPQVPPFYFLAGVGNRLEPSPSPTPVINVWPYRKNVKPSGAAGFDIPMATSVISTLNGRFSNVGTSGIRGDVWNTTSNDWERVGQFGFNPIHGAAFPDTNTTDETEDVATVDSSFYAPYVSNPVVPSWYLNDSRVLDAAQNGVNNVSLRFNNRRVDGVYAVENYFNATTGNGQMPFYNLARLKLENLTFNSSHEIESLAPSATIEVRAFVYAQEGSWWVLPSDLFDATARNNTDQNRDDFISRSEQIAGLRFARQNVKINFIGAICENRTPVVNTVGNVPGVVADWMSKWAHVSLNAGNFQNAYLDNANVANGNYGAIGYSFDEDIAKGSFDEDDGLHIPLPPPRGTL